MRIYPDPVLRETASAVDDFGPELRELAEGMIDIMITERGIGLAAVQVGVTKRLIVVLTLQDVEDTDAPPLVLVNPKVVSTSKETWEYEEGCLSIPGITGPVIRARRVEVEYQDLDGKAKRVETDAFFGRILLHEIDHLNGRLFIDYLSTAQKSLIKPKLKELKAAHGSS